MIEILITVLVAPGIIALIVHRIIKAKKYREQVQSVTSLDRGTWSERDLIPKLLDKCGIDKRVIYHDLYIRKENGTYTQIDLAVPTPQGIIVFEVKDYSGWIFGNGNSKYWMQILAYGEEKHQFYNPIWQNRTHINALRKLLPNNPDVPIFNIVVFYGNSEFKDLNYDTSGRVRVIYNTQVVELVILADNYTEHKIRKCKFVLNGTEKKISKAQDRSGSVFVARRVSGRAEPQIRCNDGGHRPVA